MVRSTIAWMPVRGAPGATGRDRAAGDDDAGVEQGALADGPGHARSEVRGERVAELGDARHWQRLSDDDRRRSVLDCLVRYFGPRAAEPLAYTERDWTAEEFTRGCYGAHFAPGVWTGFGHALRPSVGPIHWAGAEYAVEWNGYMEGAVRSGRAAAREVLDSRSR